MTSLDNLMTNGETLNEEAVTWLISNTTECQSGAKTMQRYALAVFHQGTNGEQWNNDLDWRSEKDECLWFGVNCNNEGLVIEVDLSK